MKRIAFSRKTILHAIRAACLALYFAAAAAAHAQVANGDGHGNITLTSNGQNSYSFGPSSTPPLATGGTVTIAAGSSSLVPGNNSVSSTYSVQILTPSTINNSGSMNAYNYNNISGGPAATLDILPLTTAGNITIHNTSTGTITASTYIGSATAINVENVQQGSISITNDGQISAVPYHAGQASIFTGIFAQDSYAQGTITLGNNGTISATGSSSNGYGAMLTTSGSGGMTVTNSGTITENTTDGEANAGEGLDLVSSGSGAITVTNSGLITGSSSYGSGIGINARAFGNGAVTITNTGSVNGANSTGSNGYGINVASAGSGAVTVSNGGAVTASAYHQSTGIFVNSTGTGAIGITNSANGTIASSSGDYFAYGIAVNGTNSNVVTISNAAALTVNSGHESIGISSTLAGGSANITNSGAITFGGGGGGESGIGATGNGDITITNNVGGNILATNASTGSGIYAHSSAGAVQITNHASLTSTGSSYGYGIFAQGASVGITNSGTISASGNNGNALGIEAYTNSGAVTVNNSGSITASTSGIYRSYGIQLLSPGTVINSGNITAGNYAISVPDGSSVKLAGRPVITGTISGNYSSTSTSQLTFALNIPAANLAAARAQLDAEIAVYATQDGGDMTFTVDGLTFDISNFDYTNITDDLATVIARLYARTPGYQSMGTVLDHLNTNNAQASKLLTALGNVSDAGVSNALGELSPKTLEIFGNVANNIATFSAAKINNHLANRRDGLTGFDATALNVQDSSMDPSLNQVRDHLLAYNPVATPGLMSDSVDSLFGGTDMKNTQVNTMPVDRWSTFIAGDVILADLSHNANLEDANYTTGNVTAGVDYRLDDHFTIGALFAYSRTDADLDSRGSSATVDSYSPGIYASYVNKGWYGNFLGTYGRNAYTSDRIVDIPGLQGDNHGGTSGNQGTINLTGGYEFQKGSFKFGPIASVQYVHLALDSMQEQGPTALTIDSQDQDSFRSQLGVEGRFVADVKTCYGPMTFTPHLSLSWQHEYLDDSRGINAQFTGTGGGSFVTQTDNPDRDAAFIDVGLDANVSKNVTLFVDYETQAGQQNFFAQSAQGGVKVGF